MKLLTFVRHYIGQHVQAPGGIGGQCVDLTNLYLQDVVQAPLVRANAIDWQHATIARMTWNTNELDNFPPFGAIVVWKAYLPHGIGPNGHIAICLTANAGEIVTCDQNWPDSAPVSLILHDYGGVVGWWEPLWP